MLRKILLLMGCVFSLYGCSNVNTKEMIPEDVFASEIQLSKSLGITVTGGQDTVFGMYATVNAAEFAIPLVAALQDLGLFRSIVDLTPDYVLEANISAQSQTTDKLDYTGLMTVSYRLLDSDSQALLWADTIKTQHTATLSDAFSGVKRTTMAREGAVRKNIALLIERLQSSSYLEAEKPAIFGDFNGKQRARAAIHADIHTDLPPLVTLSAALTSSTEQCQQLGASSICHVESLAV